MLRDALIVLDFETTGLAPERGDRVLEVGAVRVEDGRIVERRQSLVDCGVRVPSHISAYTGITQAMIDGAPPVAPVLRGLLEFIGELPVVAHGASFDAAVLESECRRAGLTAAPRPFLCSLRLARRIHPDLRDHSLGALVHALRLPRPAAVHRAGADAESAARLLLQLARDHARSIGQAGLGFADLEALAADADAPALCA